MMGENWPGRVLGGKYRIVRPIGHGGLGVVYEAQVLSGDERFAVKILDRQWAHDPAAVGRFAREARAASAAASDHIVRVIDGGTESGSPYLVMELLEGEDLGKRLRRENTLPLDDALDVTVQVLRGLAAAHGQGVVHRDLKPDNVLLVEERGRRPLVKLVDFGMSKIERPRTGTAPLALTQKGVVLGTPLYMSPEQARARPDVDARTDLYSAGAILFECLAGRPPHVGESHEQIMLAICMNDAPDVRRWAPAVPDAVAALVRRSLARDEDERFQSAEEMLDALEAAALAPRQPQPAAARRSAARLWIAAGVAMLAGAVLTLLAVALAGR